MKWLSRFVVCLVLLIPLLAGCGNGDGDGVTEHTCTWDDSNWDECEWE